MHAHDHGHCHGRPGRQGPRSYDRAFAIGIGINLAYVAVEAVFGMLAGSLALVADAGHNLSDVLGLALAWAASWLAQREPTRRRTYGYRRSSILAALANAVLLLVAVGAIALEAVRRFFEPQDVASATVLWVAVVGVVVNVGTALLFASGRHGDLNLRGAYLHMVADAGMTLGVIAAALLIGLTGWSWVDPAVSLLIAGVILASAWSLLREAVNLSLDAVPDSIDLGEVEAYLAEQPGVTEVHDLHVWALGTTETALTVHLVRTGGSRVTSDDGLLARMRDGLDARFGIGHATFQIEAGDPAHPCPLAPANVV